MLINLSIDNVAVIEKANVEFSEGFNILTGETGAGKSILMDALSMVLGMRTSRDLIRADAPFANVSALFYSSIDLSELDIEPEEDGSVLLSRKLSRDGKNICKVNSSPVPLSTLKLIGERLVNIHGQNDNIALLKPSYHLYLLDEYGKTSALLNEYKSAYSLWRATEKKLSEMEISESEREQKKDMLSFRINEIKQVDPKCGEDEELILRRDALRNFSTVMLSLNAAIDALSGQGGGKDAIYSAMSCISRASQMDSSLKDIDERLTDLYYSTEDISSTLSSIASRMTFSPEELDSIEERLDSIARLKKKYGGSIEECNKNLALWEEEFDSLSFYEENLSALRIELEQHRSEMLRIGNLLDNARREAAEALSMAIENELSELDMPRVTFSIKFTPHSPDPSGLSDAEFMISTNPSESVKPLARIASGGEMSRIMLALKTALAGCDDIGVLIFDEIDTGVSGRAAAKIAKKLKNLAKGRQVICITHLPQMASLAHNHLLITKDTTEDSFRTSVSSLDTQGRIRELSRLISGDEITDAALKASAEMLKEGEKV